MNNKNKKSKSVLIAVLASLVIVTTASASLMSGCGNNDSTADEAEVIGTSVVSKVINGTYSIIDNNGTTVVVENGTDADGNIYVQNGTDVNGNEVKVENGTTPNGNKVIDLGKSSGSAKAERSENSEADEQNQNDKSNSDKSSSNSDTKNNDSDSSDNSSKGDNNEKKSDGSSSLSIDGKSFSVGDSITCVYDLTAPEKLENYQANILYDSNYLEATDAVLEAQPLPEVLLTISWTVKSNLTVRTRSKATTIQAVANFLPLRIRLKPPAVPLPNLNGLSQQAYPQSICI